MFINNLSNKSSIYLKYDFFYYIKEIISKHRIKRLIKIELNREIDRSIRKIILEKID